jgi:hypothetical protein
MKVVGEINLRGITRIVVNRTSVWEREERRNTDDILVGYIWHKTSRGPGVKAFSKNHFRTPSAMMAHVNKLLYMGTINEDRMQTRKGNINGTIIQELAYRCWPSGETLNIVRKEDSIKKAPIKPIKNCPVPGDCGECGGCNPEGDR